jgi:hypothetical protein
MYAFITKAPAQSLGKNTIQAISVAGISSILAGSSTVKCDATSGAITATLPDFSTIIGQNIEIYKSDSTINTVTITTQVGQTLSGLGSILSKQNESAIIRIISATEAEIIADARVPLKGIVASQQYTATASQTLFTLPSPGLGA